MASIRKLIAPCCLLVLAALFRAGVALAADAGCDQWDVRGHWTLIQSNNTAVSVTLEPSGNGYSGQASFGRMVDDDFWACSIAACGQDYVSFSGPAVGTLNGNAFELTIYWSDNAIGVYSGVVGPQGLIVGSTFDRNNPRSTAQWHSDRVANCATPAVVAPARPTVLLGRAAPATAPDPGKTVCDYAKSARERNSPAAPSLEKQCREYMAAHSAPVAAAPAPAAQPAARNPPVMAPHDLEVGRMRYWQDGEQVANPMVGKQTTIDCFYIVNQGAGALAFQIQPWQGLILVGGAAPQRFSFQGRVEAGQFQARQLWTPTSAGATPVSCLLNPDFDYAESNPGNNRWNETVDVLPDEEDPAPADADAPPPDNQ